MPGRYLREGILDSDRVDALSAAEEVFYRRLMSVVDDFGRFDGRPQVLKSRMYPLRVDKVRETDIALWTAACEKAGLIAVYHSAGKPYIQFFDLGVTSRAKSSKFPSPNAEDQARFASAKQCFASAEQCSPLTSSFTVLSSSSKKSGEAPPAGEKPMEEKKPAAPRKPATGPHAEAIAAFYDRWGRKYGTKYAFNTGKDGKAVKWMLAQCGGDPAVFSGVVGRFLADNDKFITDQRHSITELRRGWIRWIEIKKSDEGFSDKPPVFKPAAPLPVTYKAAS